MNSAAWRVVVWFLAGIGVYGVIKNWGGVWWDAKTWQIVAAIATWLLAGGVVFAFQQVQQMRQGRNAQLAAQLYQQFRTPEAKQDFDKIYAITPQILESWERAGQVAEVNYTLDSLEMLGLLISRGIFDETLAIRLFGGWPIRAWSRLSGYVERKRKEEGHYARYVEDFAKRSIKYQIEHYPKKEWTRLTIENKPTEYLVEELKDKLLSRRERGWAWFVRYLKHPCWICQEQWPKKRRDQKSTERTGEV